MIKLGIDIGGTKINIGLFDGRGKLIINEKYYISEISDLTAFIGDTVQGLCRKKGLDYDSIVSCGVGIPGTVSADRRKIIKAPNLGRIKEDFCQELEDELGVTVGLVQDSRAAALGEYLFGGGKGKKSVVCVTLGTGIGTGIVFNGEIFSGSLYCAGELGHLPVEENGRPCGCGKRGCLEKYCAGIGLDITAKELLGEGKGAKDLFIEAESGNAKATQALAEAVRMLGAALTSIINLLSPDCLLLSGGLSEQKELYLDPVINYIKKHSYRTEELPFIGKAELGELAPLYGAAHIPMSVKRRPRLSASIMCADILNMGKALSEIEGAGIDYIHYDIMDNHFVPNLMLPMELIGKLREGTALPFDIHIMANSPESIVEKLSVRENDIVSVHYESTPHLKKVIQQIKEKGAMVSVAINPATPIETISQVLDDIDMVLVMTVNPGFAGQTLVSGSFDKIKRMRKLLDKSGHTNVLLEVDGNCSFENVPKMYKAGADVFVVGTSSVFKKGQTVKEGTEKLTSLLNEN